MYRIYCQFKPDIKRAAGGDGMGPRQGRGAWVVEAVHDISLYHSPTVVMKTIDYPPSKVLCLCCPTRRRVGTRCNPRKLLAEYQAQQHVVRSTLELRKIIDDTTFEGGTDA